VLDGVTDAELDERLGGRVLGSHDPTYETARRIWNGVDHRPGLGALGLGRFRGRGGGRPAILACAPGERHDIGLIAFGLLLRSHGWRILFLGADTPLSTLGQAIATTAPRLVVVASMDSSLLASEAGELRRPGRSAPLVLSGAGASEELCRQLRVERLDGDLVAAADAVARGG
jgi:hypothetical protein